jgi:hypothetical protein
MSVLISSSSPFFIPYSALVSRDSHPYSFWSLGRLQVKTLHLFGIVRLVLLYSL